MERILLPVDLLENSAISLLEQIYLELICASLLEQKCMFTFTLNFTRFLSSINLCLSISLVKRNTKIYYRWKQNVFGLTFPSSCCICCKNNACFVFLLSRPEAVGVVCGCVYLVCMFLFIPARFGQEFIRQKENFPHHEVCLKLEILLYLNLYMKPWFF